MENVIFIYASSTVAMIAKTMEVAPLSPAHEIRAICFHFAPKGFMITVTAAGLATNVRNNAIAAAGSIIDGICDGNAKSPRRKTAISV